MNKIQVLALDDDNHSVCFVTRGSHYGDAASFMRECLLKPHTVEYEVRMVTLVDFEDEEDWEVDYAFDCLACIYNPGELFMKDPERWNERELAFDLFWERGNKEYFYV